MFRANGEEPLSTFLPKQKDENNAYYHMAYNVLFGLQLHGEAVYLILNFVTFLLQIDLFVLYFILFFPQLLPTRPPFSNIFDFLSENYF